jgi:hypothetical protein
MIIDKNLVIDYSKIIDSGGDYTSNNIDFYAHSEKRLRWKLNDLEFDYNKFYNCFDQQTLEILKPVEWQELSNMSLKDMRKLIDDEIDDKKWDWLGDDFCDMENYLSFIETHELNIVFSHYTDGWKNDDDYMIIHKHDMSFLKTDLEKSAYIKGIKDGMGK